MCACTRYRDCYALGGMTGEPPSDVEFHAVGTAIILAAGWS